MRRCVLIAAALAALALELSASAASAELRWTTARKLPGAVDLAGPRGDGSLFVAAGGRLSILRADRTVRAFARGRGGYSTDPGTEAYIARSPGQHVPGAGCSFARGDVFALETGDPGVVRVGANGRATRFANLPSNDLPAAIAFDDVGRFRHRLLVVQTTSERSSVVALDCRGRVRTITGKTPHLEGGMAVAPEGFGRFGGQLIAPDELGGRLVAIDPSGISRTVVDSGLRRGPDIGVESLGFVPANLRPDDTAYVADAGGRTGAKRGVDRILRLSGRALAGARVEGGDLLGVTESGGLTVAVRCRPECAVRRIAHGPASGHIEGHVTFAPSSP